MRNSINRIALPLTKKMNINAFIMNKTNPFLAGFLSAKTNNEEQSSWNDRFSHKPKNAMLNTAPGAKTDSCKNNITH
ncbi:hypothetical protein ABFY58_05470 [Enterobacter soli]